MGVLWEIVQTGLMYKQHRVSGSMEERVLHLENRVNRTEETIRALVKKLEEIHGIDIDEDGRVC
ncbi:MAG: hypothetical protein ABIK65_08895 [Candidatus Eisenbacteria bacterium]